MTNGVAYKVVRKLEDGTLVSSFTDDKTHWPHYPRLTYEYGKITMQHPDATDGIFCHRRLETAILSRDISNKEPCTAEVHEVYPIGKEIRFWVGVPELVNYSAVLFGRKVADIER